MKSRKLLGVTALFYTDKKWQREWDRLSRWVMMKE
jgi:hypothetical protein